MSHAHLRLEKAANALRGATLLERGEANYTVMVPRRGLEPPHLAALVPETSASTNFATWANSSGARILRLETNLSNGT
jgi:hypothetical protein